MPCVLRRPHTINRLLYLLQIRGCFDHYFFWTMGQRASIPSFPVAIINILSQALFKYLVPKSFRSLEEGREKPLLSTFGFGPTHPISIQILGCFWFLAPFACFLCSLLCLLLPPFVCQSSESLGNAPFGEISATHWVGWASPPTTVQSFGLAGVLFRRPPPGRDTEGEAERPCEPDPPPNP